MAVPIDLAHHVRENVLEIAWEDGLRARLPVPLLRGWCPCATCQGHAPGMRFKEPGPGITLVAADEVGSYALGMRFSDGHDGGIYTWSLLRQLAEGRDPSRV